MLELKNKPTIGSYSGVNNEHKIKGDAVVGCDAGVLLFYEMNATQSDVVVVSGLTIGNTTAIEREKVKFNSYMRLRSDEPVTHLYELQGGN